jgi:selenocysteine-specific elongation factor
MSEAGRIATTPRAHLPLEIESSVRTLESRWRADPFYSPDVPELQALRLGAVEQAAAERAGRVLVVAKDVVLSPGAVDAAAVALLALPGPFTLSQARKTLSTTRRVAVPLLERMDRTGRTDRISPELRRVVLRER